MLDDNGQGLSDTELKDELLTFLFAGHETTATALTWALYWIHRNPEVLQKLQSELGMLSSSNEPMMIAKLPYLTAVVNEVLRIHPVAMLMFPRWVEVAINLAGFELHPGDVLLGCIQAVHERTDLYTDPLLFNPDRFLKSNYSLYEFLPFGEGSRRCIGSALALYEMKLILAYLVKNQVLKLTRKSDHPNQPRRRGFTLRPSRAVRLQIIQDRLTRKQRKTYTASAATFDETLPESHNHLGTRALNGSEVRSKPL